MTSASTRKADRRADIISLTTYRGTGHPTREDHSPKPGQLDRSLSRTMTSERVVLPEVVPNLQRRYRAGDRSMMCPFAGAGPAGMASGRGRTLVSRIAP